MATTLLLASSIQTIWQFGMVTQLVLALLAALFCAGQTANRNKQEKFYELGMWIAWGLLAVSVLIAAFTAGLLALSLVNPHAAAGISALLPASVLLADTWHIVVRRRRRYAPITGTHRVGVLAAAWLTVCTAAAIW